MILKVIKYGVLTLVGGTLITSLLLGSEAMSYVRSSAKSVRMAVKDNIPIEFELRRARDLLDDILPEMQANVRLMAQQEVEIDAAKEDIEGCQKSLADEGVRVQKLRDVVASGQSQHVFADITYTRDQLKQELARRFEHYREAESALAAKKKLLDERRRALAAAEQQFEQMRVRKVALEGQNVWIDMEAKPESRCLSARVDGVDGSARIVPLSDGSLATLIAEELGVRTRDWAFEEALVAGREIHP